LVNEKMLEDLKSCTMSTGTIMAGAAIVAAVAAAVLAAAGSGGGGGSTHVSVPAHTTTSHH